MNIQSSFLTDAQKEWPRLPEAELDGLSEEHKLLLRVFEGQAITREQGSLADLVINCTNRFQFAKTYSVLKKDLQQTFESTSLPPGIPDDVGKLLRKVFMSIGEKKLVLMARWFYVDLATEQDRKLMFSGGQLVGSQAVIESYIRGRGCGSVVLLIVLPALAALLAGCL